MSIQSIFLDCYKELVPRAAKECYFLGGVIIYLFLPQAAEFTCGDSQKKLLTTNAFFKIFNMAVDLY